MSARIIDEIGVQCGRVVRVIVFLFLVSPLVLVYVTSVNPQPEIFPPRAISIVWYQHFLVRPDFRNGLLTTLVLAFAVTVMAVAIGTLCAFPLARLRFRGRNLLTVIFLSPLAVPQIVTGVALLNFFVATDLISSRFYVLLLAHTIVALPYVIRVVAGSLIGFDRSLEEASLNLGATWTQTIMNITLPTIRSGLLAGALFAFQASFSNVTVSVFLSSAQITPLPVVLFSWIRFYFNPSLAAVSVLLMTLTISLVLILERVLGLEKLVGAAAGLQSI